MPLIQKLIVVPEFLIDSLLLGHKDVGRSQIQKPTVLVVVAVGLSRVFSNEQYSGWWLFEWSIVDCCSVENGFSMFFPALPTRNMWINVHDVFSILLCAVLIISTPHISLVCRGWEANIFSLQWFVEKSCWNAHPRRPPLTSVFLGESVSWTPLVFVLILGERIKRFN